MQAKIPKEKVAAIAAAVTAYMAQGSGTKVASPMPAQRTSPWALAGRQEAMRTRQMMQRRIMR